MISSYKHYPLSHAQKRIYYIEKKYPGTGCHNNIFTVKYREKLDKELLEKAINKVLEKNEGLRLRITELEFQSEPHQYFSSYINYRPDVVEFHGPESEAGLALAEWLEKTAGQPFPLLQSDLFYFALVKFNDEEYGYLMKLHHIISDGRTFFLLAAEIHKCYEDLQIGKVLNDKPNPSYCQYLADEKKYLKSMQMQEDREFWHKNLIPLPPEVNLWQGKIRKTHFNDIDGAEWHQPFPDGLRTRLHSYCRANQTTLFKFLFPVFAIFISRAAGLDDFVIVTAHHNRHAGNREKMTGMFVSTVPLRLTVNNNLEFRCFVEDTGKQINYIFKNHQQYPFDQLAAEIKEKTGIDAGYLTNINFVGHPELDEKRFFFEHQFPGADPNPLTVHINYNNKDMRGILELEWDYQTALFSPGDIERFHRALLNILDDALNHPGKKISELQWVSPVEKEKILYQFNATDSLYRKDCTLHQLFEEQAAKTPDYIAVTAREISEKFFVLPVQPVRPDRLISLTYRQLNEQADHLAGLLMAQGVLPDDIIGIMMARSVELIIGILGILKAGGAYLPIDPGLPQNRVDFILKDSGAILLADANGLEGEKVRRWEGEKGRPRRGLQHKLAYVIYTSGSTGKPKGVMVQHVGVVNLVYFHREIFKTDVFMRSSQVSNQGFDALAFELWPCLSWGGVLHIVPDEIRVDPAALKAWLIRYRITASFQHTAMVTRLLDEDWPGHGCLLNILWTAGDRLPAYPAKHYPFRLYNLYGPTEDTVWTTWFETPVKPNETQPPLIGKPVANHHIYILGKDLNLQPIGIPGELCISGTGLARGYLNNPELTEKQFSGALRATNLHHSSFIIHHSKLYFTGDLARWLADGNIEFLGRMDTQVKIRGFRIELGEIETYLAKYSFIKEAVVTASEDEYNEKRLCVYFVAREKGGIDIQGLKKYLAQHLPYYMVPQYYVQIDHIPLNAGGKVNFRALPEPGLKTGDVYTAPRSSVEKLLVEIWRQVLFRKDKKELLIGIDDNFFETGGHSIKAMILSGLIEKNFQVKCSLTTIFQRPTIRKLGLFIGETSPLLAEQIPPVEEKEYYPLSPAQKGLFFLDRWENIGTTYHMSFAFRVTGKLDIDRLRKVEMLLIERHESFRTSFHLVGDEPVQRIHKPEVFGSPYQRTFFQKGSWPPEASFIQPFDLSCAPLLQIRVNALSTEETLLVFEMHHIIGDGISMGVFLEEFSRLYNSGDPEVEAGRMPLPAVRYRDFAQWQNRRLENGILKEQENYWLNLYPEKADIPRLELLGDFPRPSRLSFAGDDYRFTLTLEETVRFRHLIRVKGVTPYMGLIAAFIVLLYKYTGQDDMVVGTGIMGRRHVALENIIGMFVNTLAIRYFPRREISYEEFLVQVKDSSLKAFENQDMPFETLVERLKLPRDPAHNPLFDILFIFQDYGRQELTLKNAVLTPYPLEKKNAKFDLTFFVEDKGDKIILDFEYRTALFKKETIVRLEGHFKQVLNQVIEMPGMTLGVVDLLSAAEKRQLVEDFNNTVAEYPSEKTIHQLFEEQAAKTPDYIAVTARETRGTSEIHETFFVLPVRPVQPVRLISLTYCQLNTQAGRLAGLLWAKGVLPGDIVGIMMERSVEMVIGVFGILKVGGAYLPIDPGLPQNRIDFMLKDSRTGIIINEKFFKGSRAPRPGLHHSSFIIHHSKPYLNLAYVIYTSGSTGKPKGVLVEHRSVVNRLNWMQKHYLIGPGDMVLHKTAFTFDVSVWEIFWWSMAGARVYLLAPGGEKDPAQIADAISREYVTVMHFVPSMLRVFLDYMKESKAAWHWHSLKQIIASGEALTVSLVSQFNEVLNKENNVRLANLYGPTEATIDVSYFDCPVDCRLEKIPIGRPIDNTLLIILSKWGDLQPIGAVGELCISGAGLARGYLNNPELTAEKFNRSYRTYKTYILYKTGDLVRWLSDGNIEFLGRMDTQVKIRGFRIELGEIEKCLTGHPLVKDVVVTAREDKLCAYILPRKAGGIDIHHLNDYLAQHLPHYMVPQYYVEIERLPLSPSGKVNHGALTDPQPESSRDYTAPRGPVEATLTVIWQDILFDKDIGTPLIGSEDNFFMVGGHSLKAMTLAGRIEKNFHIKCSLMTIFQYPTIRQLAHYMGGIAGAWAEPVQAVEEKEFYPLSSAQKRLFFLDRWENIGASYNMTFAFRVKGKLDIDRLQKVVMLLIERHESLRTSFHLVGNEPVQRIHKPGVFGSPYQRTFFQKGSWSPGASFIQPFDLSCPPLLRVRMNSLSTEEMLLVFDIHHIIGDGVSMEIFFAELVRLYNSGDPEVEVKKLPLPEVRYRDFALWQNRLLSSGLVKEQEDYWLGLYPDVADIPRLELPGDFPRPVHLSFEGDHYRFSLTPELSRDFLQWTRRCGVTLYMNLLASFLVLLYKYTGQNDMVVGTGIMGRGHAALENVIGMFVNTLAIRYFPNGEMSCREFLDQVKDSSLEAFENQDMQFEALVERLHLPRDPGHNPLCDVLFVLQNFQPGELNLEGAVLTPYLLERKHAKFDITLFALENEGILSFTLEYCTALFKKETMERLGRHFIQVLKQVPGTPGMTLDGLELLSAAEKRQLVEDFNNTAAEYPSEKTIHQLFEEQAAKTPDYIAVTAHEKFSVLPFPPVLLVRPVRFISLTYCELHEQSNRLANYLYRETVTTPGECMGILMDRSLDRVMVMLGILKSGSAYVPLESTLPEERIKAIINDAAIRTVISQKKYIRRLNRLQWECRSFHTFLCLDSENIQAEEEVEQNALMDLKLWEYVGETAQDEITGGGWLSSYTGEPIPAEEMAEYGANVLRKLEPLLHSKMRVLEIGCASGITMFRIAPKVGFYYGTDLSPVIIEKNKQRVKEEKHRNIQLACMAAHEIDKLEEENFDLVIINSVIQCFHGHNYLRRVLKKVTAKMNAHGYLFIGDIMDQELKQSLIRELKEFKKNKGKEADYRTKTDWSAELFVGRDFFEDLQGEIPEIAKIEFSRKIYTLENELTKFRYDALLTIDKEKDNGKCGFFHRHKYQGDSRALEKYGNKTPAPAPVIGSDRPAYVIFTSGTTGTPRGVMVEHRSLVNLCWWHHFYYDITEKDRAVQFANFSFDASVWEVFPYLVKGVMLNVVPQEMAPDVEALHEYFEKHGVTIAFLPTPLCEQFMAIENHSLRILLTGGNKLEHFIKREYILYNNYGPTENTVVTTAYKVEDFGVNIPIGKPISNNQIYILAKKNGQLQSVGVPGELCITGVGVARGYLNNPELTNQKFLEVQKPFFKKVSGPRRVYKTGDLARWLADGNIEFLGRIDRQVKIRGFRIELEEIRRQLEKHEDVKEAVVVIREDADGEKKLCAYIVSQGVNGAESGVDIAAKLSDFLAVTLPDYMIPVHFVLIARIPLTNAGKIAQKALPPPGLTAFASGGLNILPRDELEKTLAEIWNAVLNPGNSDIVQSAVSIDTDFFKAGGHSLKVAALVSRIHEKLNVRPPLAQVFTTPTIRGLAEYIRGAAAVHERWPVMEPAPVRPYYPLYPAQRRIYILDRLGAIYNMPRSMTVLGNLDVQRLEFTLRQLIQRHEVLRTSFHMIDDQPVQEIHDEVDFKIEHILAADAANDRVKQIETFIYPFDLAKAPLLRVKLIEEPMEKGQGQFVLMIDTHHIVSDGISQGIFMKELCDHYAGQEILPPLRLQYKDYAWQQHRQQENRETAWRDMEKYWIQRFQDEIWPLVLPYDFPRPPAQDYQGKTIDFALNSAETRALKAIGWEVGATLYMTVTALLNVLLAKLSGSEDIVVGTPIAGRNRPDLQSIIGMFVGTLAVRNFPVGEKNFTVFLGEVKENALAAFENQDYPFEELVEKVIITRDAGRNPLFDVMLAVQNIDWPEIEIPGLIIKPRPFDFAPANVDLFWQFFENGEIIKCTLTYSTSLFVETTIRRFMVYFNEIIKAVAQDPRQKLADIDMLPGEEKKQVLYDFNQTEREFPRDKTFLWLLKEQVERTPDYVALIARETAETFFVPPVLPVRPVRLISLTYCQLNNQAGRLAGLLSAKGVLVGDIVAIMLERSLEIVIGLLGIWQAGAAFLTIDPRLPEERIDYMLAESGAAILLTGHENKKKANGQFLIVNGEMLTGGPHGPQESFHHSNLAYVLYTSGSTGVPKGIMIEHKGLVNFIMGITAVIPFMPMDSILALTTISFDIFILEMLLPLTAGSKVVIGTTEQQVNPVAFAAVMQREAITHLQVTPSRLQLFINHQQGEQCLQRLNYLLVGGELFPDYLLQKVQTIIKGKIYNLYGPTETTIWSMLRCVEKGDRGINIGQPMANTQIYILSAYGRVQPVEVPGELCITGVGVARGYLNNPEQTAEKFNRSYRTDKTYILYKTGDLARRLADGSIEFLGRRDGQVKIRGFRIELGEIETLLLTHKNIAGAVVVVLPDHSDESQLVAYVKLRQDISVSELRDYLSRRLPDYMIPGNIVFLEHIPLTPSGKVDRKALPEPGATVGVGEYSAPRDEIEEKLQVIWSEILGRGKEQTGIASNFFQMGGHSLRVINMIMRIHREFNVKIGMTDVFKKPTIRGVAELIRGANGSRLAIIPPAEKKEYYPLSSAQERLYILYCLDPGSTVYNMTTGVILEGRLNSERLENIFRKLIRRHESLRTSFQMVAGSRSRGRSTVQRIHEQVVFEIEYEDLASDFMGVTGVMDADSQNQIIQSFACPLNFARAPLLRVVLLRLAECRYLLIVDMPHIIADGLAHRLLVEEFMALYRGEALLRLQMQYKDFSEWQNSPSMQEEMHRQEAYWLRQFAGAPGDIPALQIPLDYPRTEVRSVEGSNLTFELHASDAQKLREMSFAEGTTLFMTVLAVFNVLLYKLSGQEDIVVGAAVAGRNHPDLERIIGVFTNTLALRHFPKGHLTFQQFLTQVKERTLAAFENQDYQFEELVQKIMKTRVKGRHPLFDVMFGFTSYIPVTPAVQEKLGNDELHFKPYRQSGTQSRFDITFTGADNGETFVFLIEYSTAMFKPKTMERFAGYFQDIAAQVTHLPRVLLKDIAITTGLTPAVSDAFQDDENDFRF